jgi:hypothetical protein
VGCCDQHVLREEDVSSDLRLEPWGVGFGRRPFLCEVARRLQRSPLEAPILPEPDFLHVRAWRASHSSRHRTELTFAQLVPASEQRGSSQWSIIGVISSISAAKYSRGALWQRPLLPSFLFFLGEHPVNFLQGTRPWQRLGIRLTTCCWIRASASVGVPFCLMTEP